MQEPQTAPRSTPSAEAVWEVLNQIHDPCSLSFGCPLSLVEMQLIRAVECEAGVVSVKLQLTEPTCVYTFRIGDEIKSQLRARWGETTGVEVHLVPPDTDDVWTEDRILEPARQRLIAFRAQRRKGPARRPFPQDTDANAQERTNR